MFLQVPLFLCCWSLSELVLLVLQEKIQDTLDVLCPACYPVVRVCELDAFTVAV